MPKITVATPSVRLDGSQRVWQTLRSQTNKEWEWLLSVPPRILPSARRMFDDPRVQVLEQEHSPEDTYDVYKTHDRLAHEAQGELVVQTCDWIWMGPQALDILWHDYQCDRKSLYSIPYYHYSRYDEDLNFLPDSFYHTNSCCPHGTPPHPIDLMLVEFGVCSVPRAGYEEVGGLDWMFDKMVGNCEKEFAARLRAAGYNIMTDHRIELRGFQHEPGLGWEHPERYSDATFQRSINYLQDCLVQIQAGTRRKLNNHIWNGHADR